MYYSSNNRFLVFYFLATSIFSKFFKFIFIELRIRNFDLIPNITFKFTNISFSGWLVGWLVETLNFSGWLVGLVGWFGM